jgi:hypothetical protein
MSEELLDAIKFFQGVSPFGEIGSYILDNENRKNDLFAFKHQYIAHTLEDGILFDLLTSIRQTRWIIFENQSTRTGRTSKVEGLPLKIFVSTGTGRRYACMYSSKTGRFSNFRLDYIKKVTSGEIEPKASDLRERLNNNLDKIWGVSFGGKNRSEIISIKLDIDEKRESYVIDRITREGQGGKLTKIEENTFLFTKEVFDTTDMIPWIKTFTGRIIQLEGTNSQVVKRFYDDMKQMASMYGIETSVEEGKEG